MAVHFSRPISGLAEEFSSFLSGWMKGFTGMLLLWNMQVTDGNWQLRDVVDWWYDDVVALF